MIIYIYIINLSFLHLRFYYLMINNDNKCVNFVTDKNDKISKCNLF